MDIPSTSLDIPLSFFAICLIIFLLLRILGIGLGVRQVEGGVDQDVIQDEIVRAV